MEKNNLIERQLQVRALTAAQVEARQAEFVISTEAVDSFNTVFRADGWDLTRYENNPIVLYGHRSWDGDPDNIIGTGEVFREGDQLIGRVTFEDAETNPKAEKVFRKVQAGTLRMASIGADPKAGHWGKSEAGEDPEVFYFDRQELLEFSIVPVGSNPDALKRSAQVVEDFKEQHTREMNVTDAVDVSGSDENKRMLSRRKAQYLINKNL
jgi:HK97 family phage prohead protease